MITMDARAVSLQEALRTIGLELESHRPLHAQLVVTAADILVDAAGAFGQRRYTWGELARRVEAEHDHRGKRSAGPDVPDAGALTRWSTLLRVIGQLLDAQAVRACQIVAAPGSTLPQIPCRVEVTAAGRVLFQEAGVEEQALLLRVRRREPPTRPWRAWPFRRRS